MIKPRRYQHTTSDRHLLGYRQRNRKGAMLVLIAIMMIGFMVAVAFSIDIAQMHLSRTELRTATDAASKAAAATLAQSQDTDLAITRGQQIAAANTVNGDPLLLDRSDFTFGRSVELGSGKFEFSGGGIPRNSVHVDGRRTVSSRSGPVPLFFGNIFGVEFFEPIADATATYIERDIVLVVDRSGSMAGQKFVELVNAMEGAEDHQLRPMFLRLLTHLEVWLEREGDSSCHREDSRPVCHGTRSSKPCRHPASWKANSARRKWPGNARAFGRRYHCGRGS